MLFASTMPTHAGEKQGAARIISFKTSQEPIPIPTPPLFACMIAQLVRITTHYPRITTHYPLPTHYHALPRITKQKQALPN
jgi:hypothetical protein